MEEKRFFKEIGSKSVVDQIVDNIVNAIISGDLKPGDKIPTENELCASMRVGRNSVREAIKILVAYGVLEIRRAEGTFVRDSYDQKMLYPVLYGIILQGDSATQIVELRKILDVGILHMIVDKIDAKSLKQAEDALEQFKQKVTAADVAAEEIFEADVAFHAALKNIVQNSLLDGIYSYVEQITRMSRVKTIEKYLREGAMEKFIGRHQELIYVLKGKQRDRIGEVVENHYDYWKHLR